MRENLGREYDIKFFEIGFSALAARIPRISVHEFSELDSDNITATIMAFDDVRELKNAVAAYVIADDDYVEIDPERLYHEITETETPIDAPVSLLVDEYPVEESISDTPASLPVDEYPAAESISYAPVSLPFDEYPVEDRLQTDVDSVHDIDDYSTKEKTDLFSEIEAHISEEIEEDINNKKVLIKRTEKKVSSSASISEKKIKEPIVADEVIEKPNDEPLISKNAQKIDLFEQIEKDIESQDQGSIETDESIDTLTEIITDIDSDVIIDTTALPDIDYDHLVGEIESSIDVGAEEMAKAKNKAKPEPEEVKEEDILDESEMISRLVEEVSKTDDDEFKQITEANIRKGGEADEGAIKAVLDTFAKDRQKKIAVGKLTSGRRAAVLTKGKRGRYVKSRIPQGGEISDIAVAPTIRAAAAHAVDGMITIKNSDLREKVRRRRVATLLGIVVDASGSMSNTKKVEITKTVVLALLKDAYQRRDKVSLVTYAGRHADVVLPFTSSVEMAKRHMEDVKFGSTTPLAAGMLTGTRVLKSEIGKEPSAVPIMILITDGTANVPLSLGGNIEREVSQICTLIKNEGLKMLVIDISQNGSQLAKDVSSECMGQYFHPSSLSREALYCAIKKEQDIVANVVSSKSLSDMC